jgi:hypothetical protein
LKPEREPEKVAAQRERAERRQQPTQAMTDLLTLVRGRKPYEELVEKASLLNQHVRFFFPKPPQKEG